MSLTLQVRYDRRSNDSSAVKFMTDGILLREAQADFLLRKYSCLIIDEAHERSLNTDLLIGRFPPNDAANFSPFHNSTSLYC